MRAHQGGSEGDPGWFTLLALSVGAVLAVVMAALIYAALDWPPLDWRLFPIGRW